MKNDWTIPVFGLTGSIASGKSAAARLFKRLGAQVVDADRLLRTVTARGSPAYRRIVSAFGEGVLDSRGRIDRTVLGEIVFRDREKRALLEAVTHDEIMKAADRRIRRVSKRRFVPVLLEAALLVESGIHRMLDGLVVVTCDETTQAGRLRETRKMSEEQIGLRLRAQMSHGEKAGAAGWIIRNDGTLEDLRAGVEKVFRAIRKSDIYLAKKSKWARE
jgi:dephospho-CoA kinase